MKRMLMLSAMAFALAACQTNKTSAPTATQPTTPTRTQQTTYNQADHYDTRVHHVTGQSYLCDNGFTVGTTVSGNHQLLLSVAYGMPKPATATLSHQNDGSYASNTGLFGKGARWQATGTGTGRLSYGMNDGRSATVNCQVES